MQKSSKWLSKSTKYKYLQKTQYKNYHKGTANRPKSAAEVQNKCTILTVKMELRLK